MNVHSWMIKHVPVSLLHFTSCSCNCFPNDYGPLTALVYTRSSKSNSSEPGRKYPQSPWIAFNNVECWRLACLKLAFDQVQVVQRSDVISTGASVKPMQKSRSCQHKVAFLPHARHRQPALHASLPVHSSASDVLQGLCLLSLLASSTMSC